MYRTGEPRWGDPGDGGFLGMAHAPFRLVGGKATATAASKSGRTWRCKGVTLDRLQDRVGCCKAFDDLDRQHRPDAASWTAWTRSPSRRSASSTSSKLADALDLSKEDPKVAGTLRRRRSRPSSATARRGWCGTSASPAGWSRPAPAW